MPITRRGFIRHTLAIGPVAMVFWMDKDLAWAQGGAECTLPDPGTPKRFIPNEPKVLTRYSAREMADPGMATQLEIFRKAIGLVRGLPPDDVISWTKMIAQHCIHCASTNTSNIHYDWMFLPWHRGMLYFLERNLRKISGNDDVRLVYWDWESSQSRTLPSIYAPEGQPLYWARRNLTGSAWPLSDGDVNVQPLLAIPDFPLFGGTSAQRQPTPAAYSGPHAKVHNAFGPGDMSNLQYSPRDPVFYAHHGNIDRLWSSWVAAGHKNPDFGDAKVYFYDENRVWSYVLLNDLRDETKLGYNYSSLMKPAVAASALRAAALPKAKNQLTISGASMQRMAAPGPEFLVIENLKNLDKLPMEAVEFGIFVDAPPVGTQSETAEGFLGSAARVLSEGHAHEGTLSAAIEVTGKLVGMAQKRKGAVQLHVAPLDPAGKTTAPAIPLEADRVHLIS
jgi:polyphenol oxidase